MAQSPTKPAQAETPQEHSMRHTAILVLGDIIAFIVFATLGRGSHGEATGFAAPLETLSTAAPFIVGWFIVAPLVGAYGPATRSTVSKMAGRTGLAWLLALPIALGLRALYEQRGIPGSFAIVAGTTNLIFLVGWRTLLASFIRRSR